jgi:hypothetical protein
MCAIARCVVNESEIVIAVEKVFQYKLNRILQGERNEQI